ncbi:MAG: triphosphoribosyl-dephospho-CoA synthase CitG [Clostridium sp.]
MDVQNTPKQAFLDYLEQAILDSLIDEVSATPKPGLVDLHDSGAHTDMDFDTFMSSAEAITPYLAAMAKLGTELGTELRTSDSTMAESLFLAIRPIGIEAETAMFAATGGVNTHKGMIFSMGMIAAAAGFIFSQNHKVCSDDILKFCRPMCRLPLEKDFEAITLRGPQTHGERLYVTYGCRGIRGEAADGFPSIRTHALPILREQIHQSPGDWNQVCLRTLLELMAEVDDTNILFRTDYPSLLYAKESARSILSIDGDFTVCTIPALEQLNLDFIKRNISPGGCADLLAITLFLWRLEQFSLTNQ